MISISGQMVASSQYLQEQNHTVYTLEFFLILHNPKSGRSELTTALHELMVLTTLVEQKGQLPSERAAGMH